MDPQENDLLDGLHVDQRDKGAPLGKDIDQAIAFQPHEGAVHRRAGDVEAVGQFIFTDFLAGKQMQRQDLLFQKLIDLL